MRTSWPSGPLGCEQFVADLGADDDDRRAAVPVLLRQGPGPAPFEIADGDEFGRRAGDHDLAQLAAVG